MRNPAAVFASLALATLTIGLAVASPIAVAVAIVLVSLVAFGGLDGPDLSYLDRAPTERVVIGVVVDASPRRLTCLFERGHDAHVVAYVDSVVARLDAQEVRAIKSRHVTRAEQYRARRLAFIASMSDVVEVAQ